MNKPFISIVVPVYNAEKTVEQCIRSILDQTYTNFEVLIIDDGSIDESFSLCRKYADKDKRIKIFQQENAGVSAARNRGINYATGDFLTFVDSDDYIEKNYLEEMIKPVLFQKGKGAVIGGVTKIYPDGNICKVVPDKRELYHSQIEKIYEKEYIHHYWGIASKLYDLSLIHEKKLKFKVNLNYAEDAIFLLSYLKWANYVCFSSNDSYHYIQHEGISLSRSLRSYETEIIAYRLIKKYVGEHMPLTLSTYLTRALCGLYRLPKKLPKKTRLKELRLLNKEDLNLLQCYYSPSRMWEKIGKFLIHHSLYVYDTYMSFIYTVHYISKKNYKSEKVCRH